MKVFFISYESEAQLEKRLINQLAVNGYERVIIRDEDDLFINLKTQLEKFNKITFTDEEFKKVLLHLEGGSVFDKAKKLRDKFRLDRQTGPVWIEFFNVKDWCKNHFQVTNQITIKGIYENRYDVTILINGIPLVQIELKRRGIELKKAFNQINRYHAHSFHGLFNYVQIFVISNGVNTKYYANNKELSFKFTFFWKDENNRNITQLEEFTDVFLEKCHLSKMIARYIVLNESSKSLMILRSYQYFAVEAILNKALESKKNGYVWHTTGSGKTLTSFKTAQILCEEEDIDKIMFIVDRNDLDYQTVKEFNSFSSDSVDGTDHTYALIRQLNDSSKLIVTTIQKLNNAVKKHKKQLEKVKDAKMILMFDECHRSQFGEMHSNITDFFTNIQFFGFTGTPILEENANNTKTTADIFGDRLHSYLIKDAIHDNNVLGFMVEYHGKYIDKAKYDAQVENINEKEILESEKKLSKIVDYIIRNHDAKTFNREFTSIFAVANVDVLNKYYKIFKEKNHDLKIATIYSYDPNAEFDDVHPRDLLDEHIKDYNEMFGTNYSTDSFQEYYVDISKKSKERKIDILLVVNMFLTGFDNKYLNTLYVDKNLKYHGLLQAFSRTNRILDEKKKQGNIICFRNIKQETDDALRLFSDEDAPEFVIIGSYKEHVERFNNVLKMLNELVASPANVDVLFDNDQLKFVKIFRELIRIMNRLSVFTEFNFSDLEIDEQLFEDFKSKYLDLYSEVKNSGGVKTSVLDDIDFEVELLQRDNVNVSYILALLKELDSKKPSFKKDKEFIIKTMESSPELKSKVELIEEFIDKNIVNQKLRDVDASFDEYMNMKKIESINNLIREENLKPSVINNIIINYEFSDKIKEDKLKESFNEELGLIKRQMKIDTVKEKIIKLVDKFTW